MPAFYRSDHAGPPHHARCREVHASPTPVYRWTTLAGRASIGSEDGGTTDARFNRPHALAFDAAGNLYIADTGNHTIRRITPAGIVSTFAGKAAEPGAADGVGNAARFRAPQGLAVDRNGNVYVADTGNHTLRLITPSGNVSTIAGQAGQSGTKDGATTAARFESPDRLAVDQQGNVYLSNHGIRKISGGTVTTLSIPTQATDPDGNLLTVRVERCPAVDADGNLYFATINPATADPTTTGSVAGPTRAEQYLKVSPSGAASIVRSSNYGHDTSGSTKGYRFYEDTVFSDYAGNLLVVIETHSAYNPSSIVVARMQPNGQIVDSGTPLRDRLGAALAPIGVAQDSAGKWYYTSNADHAVGSSTGTFTGTALPADGIDGSGASARLDSAQFVALDPARNVWVAETVQRASRYSPGGRPAAETRLRKISPNGDVTTPAPQPWFQGSSWFYSLYPAGLFVDSGGTVTLARLASEASEEFQLHQLTPVGTATDMAGPPGEFAFPVSDFGGRLVVINYVSNRSQLAVSYYRIAQREPDGSWSTFAGGPSSSSPTNAVDGVGAAARFSAPSELTSDRNGTLYLIDRASATESSLRKITTAGEVSTVRSKLPTRPSGLAVAPSGTFYLAYADDHVITRIGADGNEVVIGGSRKLSGSRDGTNAALFASPIRLVVDAQENIYVADGEGTTVRKGELIGYAPEIATQPASVSATAGTNVTFAVTTTVSSLLSFQWYFNGTPIAGATSTTLTLANVSAANAGDYTVTVANDLGSVTSNKASLTVTGAPQPSPSGGGSSGGSASGGGGAPSVGFIIALLACGIARRWLGR